MFFWFKRKTIYLDCFINNERTARTYPIARAGSFVPDWWKKLDIWIEAENQTIKKKYKTATMKNCYGFIQNYNHGFMIPLWSDLDIWTEESGRYYYQFAGQGSIVEHAAAQHGFNFDNYLHMKLISAWLFQERTGIKFAFIEPTWTSLHKYPGLRVLPGIVSYDEQIGTHINMFAEKKDAKYELKTCTPMAHIIPLTENNVRHRIHVLTEPEYNRMQSIGGRTKFYSFFNEIRRIKKQNSR